MNNAFIGKIRSKRIGCIFFGIIRTQDTNFLSKLSLIILQKFWKIETLTRGLMNNAFIGQIR
jgi:hypothetical protein